MAMGGRGRCAVRVRLAAARPRHAGPCDRERRRSSVRPPGGIPGPAAARVARPHRFYLTLVLLAAVLGLAAAIAIKLRPGTGKSHLVEALGHLAIDNGKTVAWHTLETLAQLLRRHRADDSINKAIGKLIRADLVVVDDVGLLPVSADAAEALFRVIDAAYEKRSIAISSNVHPSGFDELMPKSIATATVDRLLHHAHVIITEGQDSYRLAQATAGKGVKPLT